MKYAKKTLVGLLTLVMILASVFTVTLAEDTPPAGAPHYSAYASEDTVSVGEEFTVTINAAPMVAQSTLGKLYYDKSVVEFVSIQTATPLKSETGAYDKTLEVSNGEANDCVGFFFVGTTDIQYIKTEPLIVVKFKAIGTGNAAFSIEEQTDGVAEFYSADNGGNYGQFSVTINASGTPEEASISLIVDGQTIVITESEMKAATKVEVTEEDPWTFKNGQNKGYGTFYSVKSILENANVDYSEAHGLKMVASDGFVTGFTKDEIETLYIFDMAEVNRNGSYGAAGTFGTAINGSAGNKWATDVVRAEVATDHVWFFKKGACLHYCAICGEDEPSFTLVAGEQEIKVHECEMKAAEKVEVTEEDPWTFKSGQNKGYGTFYSVKSILENANVDYSEAHGLKMVASDGFVTGFTKDEIETLYIFDMAEVNRNGSYGAAGTFGTAINGSAGNKWATDVVRAEVATDHVWFFKKGACLHYCAICGEDEPSFTLVAGEQEITVHECEMKAAEKVEVTEEDPWTFKNGQNKGYGTFYSVKSILENANVDYSEAHGLKMVASDGFVTGFTKDEIETLYIFDMAEVNRNGSYGAAGTFGTAINGSAGNKWATDVVRAEVANDHVMFFKGGACKHYCAICGEEEHYILIGETKVYDCEAEAASDAEEMIEALPAADTLTLEDADAVKAAKAAYDALPAAAQTLVDPAVVKDLKLADTIIDKLEAEAQVTEQEETISNLEKALEEIRKQLEELKEQLAKTPGWHQNEDGTKYFCDANGEKAKGWLSDGGKWYFMDKETGIMKTGWVKDGSWYFLDKETGAMQTGWVKDGDDWYYMSTSGAMQTGWVKSGSSWYYLKASGKMAANEWCGGYWLNANGTWTYQYKGSWKQDSKGWWFGDTSGWYAKSTTQKIDDVEYKFDAAGYWVQ